jgi:hypothetical protein
VQLLIVDVSVSGLVVCVACQTVNDCSKTKDGRSTGSLSEGSCHGRLLPLMPKVYQVKAHLPASVELAKRKAQGTLTVEINGGSKPGKLVISRGTVEWWPDGKRVNTYRVKWGSLRRSLRRASQKASWE